MLDNGTVPIATSPMSMYMNSPTRAANNSQLDRPDDSIYCLHAWYARRVQYSLGGGAKCACSVCVVADIIHARHRTGSVHCCRNLACMIWPRRTQGQGVQPKELLWKHIYEAARWAAAQKSGQDFLNVGRSLRPGGSSHKPHEDTMVLFHKKDRISV